MSGLERLLELVNTFLERKGASLSLDDVEFSQPTKLSDVVAAAYGRNTRVEAISKKDPTDRAPFYYNRLELPILFGNPEVPIDIDFYTVEEALLRLNELYDTNIVVEDLKTYEMIPGYKARIVVGNSYVYEEDSEIIIYPKTELTFIEQWANEYYQWIHFTLPKSQEGLPDE